MSDTPEQVAPEQSRLDVLRAKYGRMNEKLAQLALKITAEEAKAGGA